MDSGVEGVSRHLKAIEEDLDLTFKGDPGP
jgi:hypothetical protein